MELLEQTKERLKDFGYEAMDADDVSLAFLIPKMEQSIKNECNLRNVPEELQYVLVDWVCGEFLMAKNGTGQLDISTLELDGPLTSITEGDVSLSFDNSMSDAVKFQGLISRLMNAGRDELICFRKLSW